MRQPIFVRPLTDTERKQVEAGLRSSDGTSTSVWTLELVAEVSFVHGLTPQCVSVETICNTLKRLGVRWKRAKRWLTSPDPAYARKKAPATA